MGMVYNQDSLLYAYLVYHYGIKEHLIQTMSEEQLISHFSEKHEGCPYTKAYGMDEFRNLLFNHGFSDLECKFITMHLIFLITREKSNSGLMTTSSTWVGI